MPAPSVRPASRSVWRFAALAVLVGIVAVLLARRNPFAAPHSIGTAHAFPLQVKHVDGAWYWRELTPKTGESLLRSSMSGTQTLAKADAVSSYDVGEGKAAWVVRSGKEWTISVAGADGAQPHIVYRDADEPMGLAIAQGRLYAVRRLPATVPDSGAFPALSPALEVIALPLSGEGKPQTVARLAESDRGEILGIHDNSLYLAVSRQTTPSCFCVYRVPIGSGFPVRVVGEQGTSRALLTKDGVLYWTTRSREVAAGTPMACVCRLDGTGHPEVLSDWLPAGGDLYETARGVLYGDHEREGTLWRLEQRYRFPESLPLPDGYAAVAASDGLILVTPTMPDTTNFALYEMPLP